MKARTYFGTYDVEMTKSSYSNNGNLALQLWEEDGPFATLSVNLSKLNNEHLVYLDTNNCPWAEDFVKENNLGYPMAAEAISGFCSYPLYYIY